ncbi:hypothetical protein WN943_023443 [Citrus x changshan-huyou]
MDKAAVCAQCALRANDASGCQCLMTTKCAERGEARQSAFDASNACSAQASHSAFNDSDCGADDIQRLGIWGGF